MLNSNYKLPTRKTVSQSLIPNLYQEIVDIVQGRLKRATAICLTVDGWSSRNQDSFYSVTAHYVVKEEKRTYLASDLLGCVSFADKHTGENIANKLKIILNEWEISEKITAIISDNASNMKLAIRIGGWKHWGCYAHSLNLVVQSGLKEVRVIVDKLTKIVRYFKKSTHAYSQLRETQERMELPALKLKNDVPTRWNSTYRGLQVRGVYQPFCANLSNWTYKRVIIILTSGQ
nr:zinc finger BED domain-containing protein 4-like [Onthophagus taurus]